MKNRAAAWPSSSAPVNFQRMVGSVSALDSHGFNWLIFWLAATPFSRLACTTTRRWPSRRWICVTCWAGTRLMK